MNREKLVRFTRPTFSRLSIVSVLIWALVVTSLWAAENAARPNILLILPDQMRASAMGCDGNAEVKTPNIDRLAAEGVRFKRSYANVPVCCPARAILHRRS